MLTFLLLCAVVLAVGLVALLRWRRGARFSIAEAASAVALVLLAWILSGPFLTKQAVGTGEAFNYSLAMADAVTQMRAGELPVLVGQTEYAFNGRIHPLRTAPYLFYFAGLLDALTLRQLSFWELQNLCLALSLAGALLVTWLALRWSTGCAPVTAGLLAGLFAFSPPLLGAAYSVDLFMTVHAAPFVSLALAAAARGLRSKSVANDVVLAIALGAVWWAHPPVALWTTVAATVLRAVVLIVQRSWKLALGGLAAAAVTAVLVSFVLVSATESTPEARVEHDVDRDAFVAVLLDTIETSYPASVQPVSREAREPSDVQLGYSLAVVLALAWWGLARPFRRITGRERVAVAVLALAATTMIVLALPVPAVTSAVWSRLPTLVLTLTNVWPGQRLFLVAGAAIVLAAAFVLPERLPKISSAARRHALILAAFAALCWVAWQAYPFLSRGFGTRWPEDRSRRSHLVSNLDLTITSYSFLGLPRTFTHGVSEPWAEFRLLSPDQDATPLQDNYTAAEAQSRTISEGSLSIRGNFASGDWAPRATLQLEPHKRYLLTFQWLAPVQSSTLVLQGPSTERRYALPSSGEPRAFGIGGEHRAGFALSTSHEKTETVDLVLPLRESDFRPGREIATYKLVEVDDAALPIRVESIYPLRASVTAPESGSYLETPRRYIPGYAAFVNGRRVETVSSPHQNVMFPVPAGESRIELRFEGSVLLRTTFWTSLSAWLGLLGFTLVSLAMPKGAAERVRWIALTGPMAIAGVTALARLADDQPKELIPLSSAGPLLMDLQLPAGKPGVSEVILGSGRTHEGNMLYLHYVDDRHVRVGIDIWGTAVESPPVEVDYRQPVELTLSGGFLLPLEAPEVKALPESVREFLRRRLQIEVNGKAIVDVTQKTFDSPWEQVTIGRSTIGGSMDHSPFTGTIRKTQRLPIPSLFGFRRVSKIRLKFPQDRTGFIEPLVNLEYAEANELLAVTYLDSESVQLSYWYEKEKKVESPVLRIDSGRTNSLEWKVDPSGLHWRLNGTHALTVPPDRDRNEALAWAGLNRQPRPFVAARFTGRWDEPPGPDASASSAAGAIKLGVVFPPDRTGHTEPLLVTGESGRADIVYVRYVDSENVVLGFDHWGVGGFESPPVRVEYGRIHQIEIALGSLYPPLNDASWASRPPEERQRHKSTLRVRLDGKEVWRRDAASYDVEPNQVTIGENSIGASSCEPAFTGQILTVERLGLP